MAAQTILQHRNSHKARLPRKLVEEAVPKSRTSSVSLSVTSQNQGIHQFCDTLPDPEHRIFTGTLDRLVVSSTTSWQPRQVVLTSDTLYFAKEGSDLVTDHIELLYVDRVKVGHSDGSRGEGLTPHNAGLHHVKSQKTILHQVAAAADDIFNRTPSGNSSYHNRPGQGSGSMHKLTRLSSAGNPQRLGSGNPQVPEPTNRRDLVRMNSLESRSSSNGDGGHRVPSNTSQGTGAEAPSLSHQRTKKNVLHIDEEEDSGHGPGDMIFVIHTKDKNSHSRYSLRARSPTDCEDWVRRINQAVAEEEQRTLSEQDARRILPLEWCHTRAVYYSQKTHDSLYFKSLIYSLILAAFCTSVLEAEMVPEDGSTTKKTLHSIELFYTIAFTVDLFLAVVAHSRGMMGVFFSDGWNYLDIFVVTISLLAAFLEDIPGVNALRLLRVFRVVKLIRFLKALRRLIDALSAAAVPVLQSFLIVLVVTIIYSVVATNLFSQRSPQFFGYFSVSMFTMLQLSYGDSFGIVARSLWECKNGDKCEPYDEMNINHFPTWFLTSYMLVVATVLFNIVIAVLLDEFLKAVEAEKHENQRLKEEKEREENPALHPGPLESLMEQICFFRSPEDLNICITELYAMFDQDESGSINFRELQTGLGRLKLRTPILLTAEDWEELTDQQRLCNKNGELKRSGFDSMIRDQLEQFIYGRILSAMNHADSSDFEMLMVLKMLLATRKPTCKQCRVREAEAPQPSSDATPSTPRTIDDPLDFGASKASSPLALNPSTFNPMAPRDTGDVAAVLREMSRFLSSAGDLQAKVVSALQVVTQPPEELSTEGLGPSDTKVEFEKALGLRAEELKALSASGSVAGAECSGIGDVLNPQPISLPAAHPDDTREVEAVKPQMLNGAEDKQIGKALSALEADSRSNLELLTTSDDARCHHLGGEHRPVEDALSPSAPQPLSPAPPHSRGGALTSQPTPLSPSNAEQLSPKSLLNTAHVANQSAGSLSLPPTSQPYGLSGETSLTTTAPESISRPRSSTALQPLAPVELSASDTQHSAPSDTQHSALSSTALQPLAPVELSASVVFDLPQPPPPQPPTPQIPGTGLPAPAHSALGSEASQHPAEAEQTPALSTQHHQTLSTQHHQTLSTQHHQTLSTQHYQTLSHRVGCSATQPLSTQAQAEFSRKASAPSSQPVALSNQPTQELSSTSHSALSTQHSALSTQHSALSTQHSALNSAQRSALNPQTSALNTEPLT